MSEFIDPLIKIIPFSSRTALSNICSVTDENQKLGSNVILAVVSVFSNKTTSEAFASNTSPELNSKRRGILTGINSGIGT